MIFSGAQRPALVSSFPSLRSIRVLFVLSFPAKEEYREGAAASRDIQPESRNGKPPTKRQRRVGQGKKHGETIEIFRLEKKQKQQRRRRWSSGCCCRRGRRRRRRSAFEYDVAGTIGAGVTKRPVETSIPERNRTSSSVATHRPESGRMMIRSGQVGSGQVGSAQVGSGQVRSG